jgi:hypothetical protein
MKDAAKYLSSMGRHGDTMLVHMSPNEVNALKGIGSLAGVSMSVNPNTGLHEAFNFGNFFKSLLPTIVGAVAAPFTGGSSLIPVLAGAATGAALNGKDPLMGALTGGIGGFGGAGIGNALSQSAAAGSAAGSAGSAAGSAGSAAGSAASRASNFMPNIMGVSKEVTPLGATSYYGPSQGIASAAPASGGIGSLGQGISNLGTEAGRSAYSQALGGTGPNADLIAAGKTGIPLGLAALSGIEPPQIAKMEEDKYDPNATLNLSGDSGLRFYAYGGPVFERPDRDSDPIQDAKDSIKYGIKDYAKGGYLNGPGDGMSDSIPATIENKQPARLADGEFVIPADVVSHLGNGSTKAGAKRLYAMMDKVRKARTGTKKQGRKINPNKFMPA